MAPLVEQLRRTREAAGLSIEDISARTKIQLHILEAIERADFEHVPGGLFVRGFLRAYAREIGLDPETVVADYLEQYEPEVVVPEPISRSAAEIRNDVILAQSDPDEFSLRKIWPVAAVAVMVIGVFMTVGSGGRGRTQPVAQAQAVGTTGQTPPPPPQPEPAPRPPEMLTFEIRPKRDVWVAATADSQRVVYRILKAGEHVTVTAREEISARIGDAEAFDYSVNGVTGQPLGAPAEVRDILIRPGSFRTFKVERPAPSQAQVPEVPRS